MWITNSGGESGGVNVTSEASAGILGYTDSTVEPFDLRPCLIEGTKKNIFFFSVLVVVK